MRIGGILLLLWLAASVSAQTDRIEIVWDQKFDAARLSEKEWRLEGGAALREGALYTASTPGGAEFVGIKSAREVAIPTARDGYYLRLEWALVPLKLGGWSQDVRMEDGAFVVESNGARPALNARFPARDTIAVGQEAVLSCDFNRNTIFAWTVQGKPQLDEPVPAWMPGKAMARVSLCDYKGALGETRWLWVRLSKVFPADSLALELSDWDNLTDPEPGRPSSLLIGQASAMEKVFRETADFQGRFKPTVAVSAAGRERESFQLVVMPVGKSLRQVRVEVSDLLHAGGKARLPARSVAWHPVGYVQTRISRSAVRRAGWWWPDVLLLAAPFDVPSGFVQPIWFTVDVPAGTVPGPYRGLIKLKPKGEASRTVGLELTVRPFALPLRGKLKTAFCFSAGMWEMWYKPDEVKKRLGLDDKASHGPLYTSNELEDVLPPEKLRELYDFLLAHRISPTTIYSSLKEGRARVVPRKEDMQYCYDRGMNATCLACVDTLPQDEKEAAKTLQDLENWLSGWDTFIQEKDWKDFTWYVHGFDESDLRPDHERTVDPSIRKAYGMIGEKFPRIKRESANPISVAHVGSFDIWTPLTMQWDAAAARARQAAGEEVWTYVACWPVKPYANLFIDFPGIDPRILPWQLFQNGATGFLYYLINLYEYQENWNRAAPKWPDRPWNALSFGCNGDGMLMYPGPNATPLASTRLENLRDGIEDYEALAMLGDLTARLEGRGGQADLVARIRPVLAVRPDVARSWTEYTQSPERLQAARAEVDSLIEEASKALGETLN